MLFMEKMQQEIIIIDKLWIIIKLVSINLNSDLNDLRGIISNVATLIQCISDGKYAYNL